ncbi:MAG TPA: hypothetical protein VGJ00_00410 [Rhabdochlamydiaceae bacterium]|jgi:hypothetical protein
MSVPLTQPTTPLAGAPNPSGASVVKPVAQGNTPGIANPQSTIASAQPAPAQQKGCWTQFVDWLCGLWCIGCVFRCLCCRSSQPTPAPQQTTTTTTTTTTTSPALSASPLTAQTPEQRDADNEEFVRNTFASGKPSDEQVIAAVAMFKGIENPITQMRVMSYLQQSPDIITTKDTVQKFFLALSSDTQDKLKGRAGGNLVWLNNPKGYMPKLTVVEYQKYLANQRIQELNSSINSLCAPAPGAANEIVKTFKLIPTNKAKMEQLVQLMSMQNVNGQVINDCFATLDPALRQDFLNKLQALLNQHYLTQSAAWAGMNAAQQQARPDLHPTQYHAEQFLSIYPKHNFTVGFARNYATTLPA